MDDVKKAKFDEAVAAFNAMQPGEQFLLPCLDHFDDPTVVRVTCLGDGRYSTGYVRRNSVSTHDGADTLVTNLTFRNTFTPERASIPRRDLCTVLLAAKTI